MRVTKNNKRFLFLAGFLALLQQDHARASATQANQMNPLMVMPQDVFNVQADNMSMKDLHAFAQTSKAGLAKVKKYFAIKKNTFMNTKCPVLTREWVINFSKTEPKIGLRDFFTQAQSSSIDLTPIVEIDGVKWQYAHGIESGKLNDLPDSLNPRSSFSSHDSRKLQLNFGKVGETHVHFCQYYYSSPLDGVLINLTTTVETISVDEGASSAAAAAPPAPSAR